MGTLVIAAKVFLAVLQALGWANNLAERRAGASEQRAKDLQNEMERTTRSIDAGSDSRLNEPDWMHHDANNRDNWPVNAAGVQPLA